MYRAKVFSFALIFLFFLVSSKNSADTENIYFLSNLKETSEHTQNNLDAKNNKVEIKTESMINTSQKEVFPASQKKDQSIDNDVSSIDSNKILLEEPISEAQLSNADIVGVWQAAKFLASGWDDTFLFYSDGTFLFEYSQMDSVKREINYSGSWILELGTLVLTVTNKTVISGGEIVETDLAYTRYVIEGGEILNLTVVPPDILKLPLGPKETDDDPSIRYKTMTFGGKQYWQFHGGVNGIFDYVDMTLERPTSEKLDFFSVELSDPSEFSDMDYVSLVRQAGDYTTESNIWHYSIIGGELENYPKGTEYYNRLNALFSNKAKHRNVFHDAPNARITENPFESYIVQISNDGTKLVFESLNEDYSGSVLYTVYTKSGRYAEHKNKGRSLLFSGNLSWFREAGVWRDVVSKIKYPKEYWYMTNADDTMIASKTYVYDYFQYDILETKTNTILYNTPIIKNAYGSSEISFLGCDCLVFSILQDEEINPNVADYYKLNFKTNKISFMFSSHINGSFSPDGKYFAYYPFDDQTLFETKGKERAFYIYEIESGETVSFPTGVDVESVSGVGSVLSWANKKELDSFLQTN
jgi:hypothetical protein